MHDNIRATLMEAIKVHEMTVPLPGYEGRWADSLESLKRLLSEMVTREPAAELVYYVKPGADRESVLPVLPGMANQHVDPSLIRRVVPLFANTTTPMRRR